MLQLQIRVLSYSATPTHFIASKFFNLFFLSAHVNRPATTFAWPLA